MVSVFRDADGRGNGKEDPRSRSKHEEDKKTRQYSAILVILIVSGAISVILIAEYMAPS